MHDARTSPARPLGALLLCLWIALASCGREPSILLVLRNADNQALAGIRIVEAAGERPLGVTDDTGRVRLEVKRSRGEIFRIRCIAPEGEAFPWRFEDPISLGDADFTQGTRLIRAMSKQAPVTESHSRASLAVETEPAGAKVYLNGSEVGRSAVLLRDLPLERVQLRLTLPGYQEHSVELLLTEGEQSYRWEMVPATAQAAPDPTNAGQTSAPPRANGTSPRDDRAGVPPVEQGTEEARPVTRSAPLPPAAPAGDATPAAPARPPDEEAVRAVIDNYSRALRGLDIESYAALFTSMPESNRKKLAQAFNDMKAQSVTINAVTVEVHGKEALARFHETRAISFKAGSDVKQDRDLVMELVKTDGGAWRIASLK